MSAGEFGGIHPLWWRPDLSEAFNSYSIDLLLLFVELLVLAVATKTIVRILNRFPADS
jgi:hypothetical protein